MYFFREGNSLIFYIFIYSLGWGCSIGDSEATGFSMFLQPSHLQASEQPTPELKHSQYRLRQPDFLQLHRFSARLQLLSPPSLTPIFAWMISSLNSPVFLQPTQAQSSPHSLPVEKHSQYILRHNVFLQVHPIFFFRVELVEVGTKEILSPSESSSCCGGVLSRGNYMFSREEWMGKALTVFIILRLWLISGNWSIDGRLKKEFLLNLEFMLCCFLIILISASEQMCRFVGSTSS